jgi:3-oxoacyl-[acyl-carrier protein] reductase
MGRLDGKATIVTGSARGIGREIAVTFAAEGASVVVADRDGRGADSVARQIGGRSVEVDVSSEADASRMAEETLSALGRIDVLVANAGIATSSDVVDMPLSQWQETLAVDLTGVFLCSRAVLPAMIEQQSGTIISIGSQLGFRGAPSLAHYSAAKAGVHGFTKGLAREVAQHGIRVNAIAPGPIDTDILSDIDERTMASILAEVPLGRLGRVEEIAPVALLLASDDGAYFTGSVVNVSGGHVM